MDELTILILVGLGLLGLGLPVSVLYLLVQMARARSRIAKLEDQVAHLALAQTDPSKASEVSAAEGPSVAKTPERPFTKAEITRPSEPAKSGPWDRVAPETTPDKEAGTISGGEPPSSNGTADVPESVPRSVVFREERYAAAGAWLKENWFLAVAAVSLALAGIFLVQYGVENGLLTPFWRVAGAVALGLALVAAGEVARRRFGDGGSREAGAAEGETGDAAHAAFLPSTFSGAGLVVLFAAVLSAHHLYGMIGPGVSFAYLILVAGGSVALGWFYGPYLTLVGISGAILTPFLVGGSSETPELFYYYFALVAVVALLIDAVRRWAWVSVLGLVGAFLAAAYIFTLGAGDAHYLAFAFIAVLAAVILPPLQLSPRHSGSMVLETLSDSAKNRKSWPEFPTRLAFGTIAASSVAAAQVALKDAGATETWLALACLLAIFAIVVFWSHHAEALSEGALWALPVLQAVIVAQKNFGGSLYNGFMAGLERAPETGPPLDASALVAVGILIGVIALWRSLVPGRFDRIWAGGAAVAAPSVVLILEALWQPAQVLGDYVWALHGIGVAVLMVLGATAVARRDGDDRERASFFALSAAAMITFAMVVLYSQTALTLAIAALILGAAYTDRLLNLRHLTLVVMVGAVAIGWRLVVDPGLIAAIDLPHWEVLLVYAGSIAALVGAWIALGPRARWQAQIMATSAAWMAGAVFLTVLFAKSFATFEGSLHWEVGLIALVWLSSSALQLWRLQIGGVWMNRVRLGLAGVFGLIGLAFLSATLVMINPLIDFENATVQGPYVFDTLMVTLVLPALIFAVISIRFTHLPRRVRQAAGWVCGGLVAYYVGLEIRRFWQGDDLTGTFVLGGELYSYTVAMLLGSTGLLFAAFFKRSSGLRSVAVVGIALTIAKVFLIDMSSLTGLIRVASFLGLGLSMAGLAWVLRVMNAQWEIPDKARFSETDGN